MALALLAVLALLALALPARALDAGAPSAASVGIEIDPRIAHVRALIEGTLDVQIEPQALFDVALADAAAIRVEAARVQALLSAAEVAGSAPPATDPAAEAESPHADHALDAALWSQRLELDRARLAFYAESPERRAEILRRHAERQQAARPRETQEQLRAREAEAERERALAAAKRARSEAERLVAEELARLIGIEEQVHAIDERFRAAHDELALRRDALLGWQRRVRDAKAASASEADTTYDAIRRSLRVSRDDLSAALDALENEHSDVPALGADPLVDVPPDIPMEEARARRAAVDRAIVQARRAEEALHEERAAALLEEITTLNRERLDLLPRLSPQKRDAITGFTAAGWDQARSEARQLLLILRYHRHVAHEWLSTLRGGEAGGAARLRTLAVVLPLLVVGAAFAWARRRTRVLLRWWDSKLAASERAQGRTAPSTARHALRLLLRTHRPLEWIALFLCVLWLLPSRARHLLEVQLLSTVVGWFLVSALIVNVIDAAAAGRGAHLAPIDEGEAGRLRLRSLRLVGRTVVVFGLVLTLSARLVGEGTIHDWVFSTCWFAALPLFLLLVRWWRDTVFERIDRVRKKTPLQAWILANRAGWQSFVAAMLGAVLLFTTGAFKLVRGWLSGFELARRIHAYLFKREIERIGEGHGQVALCPLPAQVLAELHPERPFQRWLPCPADRLRDDLVRRAEARRGGLVVVVGARGMGKSSLLRVVAEHTGDAAVFECRAQSSLTELRAAVERAQGLGSKSRSPALVLIDEAQTLVEPRIGGLARFDEAVAFARAHAEGVTWVFAIDASVWPLLKRARDARPLFDESHIIWPWNEAQLGALIADRSQAAGIHPSYDDLLDKLPPGADELDRQEALQAKRAGYERMLWDHVGGNPGLALEVWRASLGQDAAGVVHVRPLQVPDIARLERLPDSSLFVLRAVLQLAPTTVEAVAQATRQSPEDVLQDLRFGKAQGFYDEERERIRVAWPWLRAVTRLLQRRHLLVSP